MGRLVMGCKTAQHFTKAKTPAGRRGSAPRVSLLTQQEDEENERDWDPNQPEQNWHAMFLSGLRKY
jgi:hypothetical protein